MISFKQFLKENYAFSKESFEKLLKDYIHALWNKWKTAYPDEKGIESISYMEFEFERVTRSMAGFLLKADYIKNTQFVKAPKDAVKCSTAAKRCYYNALDFIQKNGTKYGELVYALFVDTDGLDRLDKWVQEGGKGPAPYVLENALEHAVILTPEGKVIDPTLGSERQGDLMFYLKIPESAWKKFKYTPNDPLHDARDFYDNYVLPIIEKDKFDFDTWIKK